MVVPMSDKCKEGKEEVTELEKEHRIEHSGTVCMSSDDDIQNMPNKRRKVSVAVTKDSFDDGEQPEKGIEDTCLTKPEEDTVVDHEKSSLVTASPSSICSALIESSTLDPSYVDNRHEKNIPSTTKSLQVNSESRAKCVSLKNYKPSGRKVAGGSSQSSKEKSSQKHQQEQPTTGGDSNDVSGSGGAGDECRGDDDGGWRRDDGDGRKKQTYSQEEKDDVEEEVEEKIDTEEKLEEKEKDTEKNVEEGEKNTEEMYEEYLNSPMYIAKCLMAVKEFARDQKNGVCNQPTEFTRQGDCFLQHFQQCSLGHTVCQCCRLIWRAFECLMSNTLSDDKGANFKERHLVILIWIYESLPEKILEVETCKQQLKRLHSSSGSGARPKKKFKLAGSSSEPFAMETNPSPEVNPVDASVFAVARSGHVSSRYTPGVIYGSKETCRKKILDGMCNHGAHDDEFNDGVIFDGRLTPNCGFYRPHTEFSRLRQLGSGSFGIVYLCYDNQTKMNFVCKIVPIVHFEVTEVLIWMRLEHQFILPLWGVVRLGNNILMISEYIPSRPLSARIDEPPRSVHSIVKWIKQLLCGLKYIHSINIVHMDIKPGNILLTYDDNVVLIDWGLAMELNINGQQKVSHPRGTAVFMAPEICRCETFNATIDIWSTVCLAINLFTGSAPWVKRFPCQSNEEYMELIATNRPPVEDIPESLDPAIRGFLVQGFGDNVTRPTASDLLGHPVFDLDEVLEDVEVDTERYPMPPPDSLEAKQAPTPSTTLPEDLPLPQRHYAQVGSSELDDVIVKLSNLNFKKE